MKEQNWLNSLKKSKRNANGQSKEVIVFISAFHCGSDVSSTRMHA